MARLDPRWMTMPKRNRKRLQKLEFLLQRSGIYSKVMGEKLLRQQRAADEDEGPRAKRARTDSPGGSLASVSQRTQPASVTGAQLKPYQLDGLVWLSSLYENGLNGILADEMGLGKTLQTIAFLSYLRERGIGGPFLIVAPLSTTANWADEFQRFAPSVPVLLYRGSKSERERQQNAIMRGHGAPDAVSVVVTSYDLAIRDRPFLSRVQWKFVVVDEGHRLKNLNCRLIRELKQLPTSNRLLLTGTPLHNNLAELWSLLNFILPDIFDDLATFEQWFQLDGVSEGADAGSGDVSLPFSAWSAEQAAHVVQKLHDILRPFLLRRVKTEVDLNLPPKKEYLLYSPLSPMQAQMYQRALHGSLRDWLIEQMAGLSHSKIQSLRDPPEKKRRAGAKRSQVDEESMAKLAAAEKTVKSIRLDNGLMQLRKICAHPYLLHWPAERNSDKLQSGATMVRSSGKLRMLDRLLSALLTKGHRVLVFSQFTAVLDILEVWLVEEKGMDAFRIDGRTPQDERSAQVTMFNNAQASCGRNVFLLSTRASGLGINLVGADTVIFFDSDWNPQVDLQAQDRVHRIGQARPILIFRLVSADTVEQHILQRAKAKRLLEAVVIQKGKFLRPITYQEQSTEGRSGVGTPDLLALLHATETHDAHDTTAQLISDVDLDRLLDRSDAAYSRTCGWTSADDAPPDAGTQWRSSAPLFEVTETTADGASGELERLLAGSDAPRTAD
ncbi:Putative ATPase [Malassezia sp. CBS 17886]|nr:Putative ATPase [Malassezia sp. CBS 17886]